MLQMTLYLTRSSHLWTFLLLEPEVFLFRLQKKKKHFNCFYRDTERGDFRPLEDKLLFCTIGRFYVFTDLMKRIVGML
jgi:hypothetical protein